MFLFRANYIMREFFDAHLSKPNLDLPLLLQLRTTVKGRLRLLRARDLCLRHHSTWVADEKHINYHSFCIGAGFRNKSGAYSFSASFIFKNLHLTDI